MKASCLIIHYHHFLPIGYTGRVLNSVSDFALRILNGIEFQTFVTLPEYKNVLQYNSIFGFGL